MGMQLKVSSLHTYICIHSYMHAHKHLHAPTRVYTYPYLPFFASEEIMEQKSKQLKFREDHHKHKDDAQDALEYYRKHVVKTRTKYAQIISLMSKEHRTEAEDSMLTKLQSEYSAFVGVDYMMSKNLPFWGESPQPAKTYYQMKLVFTFCLDNARVCKNMYLLSWAHELVNQGRFESVCRML